MSDVLAKSLRTLQSQVPVLKPVKEALQLLRRRLLRAPHEEDFRALPRLGLPADPLCVDIGGNYGQSVSSILTVVPNARVVSFEPNPFMAGRIRKRFARHPRVEVHEAALGEEPVTTTLYVPVYRGYVYDGLASLDPGEARGWLSPETVYFFDPEKLELREFTVEVRRLDDLPLRPDFMKLDVQGWEANVLRGAVRTLEACRPVVLVEDTAEDGPVMDVVRPLGYRRFQYAAGRLATGARGGNNCFLIHADAIGRVDPALFA